MNKKKSNFEFKNKSIVIFIGLIILIVILLFIFLFDYFKLSGFSLLSSDRNVFYVSPEGNDLNPGTIDEPWKSFERAFDSSKSTYLMGGDVLYLREGIYRFESKKFIDNTENIDINGSSERSTIISGYPGEKAEIYLSENVSSGWEKYSGRKENIYFIDWADYIKKNNLDVFNLYGQGLINPQLVAINGENPVLLKQVNARKTIPACWVNEPDALKRYLNTPLSVNNNQDDMVKGYFYFETDKNNENYGKLFVWLPEGENPNEKNMEVGLDGGLVIRGSYIEIANLSFRYANGFVMPTLSLNGENNIINNIDSSYNGLYGLHGDCDNCSIKNSQFNFNGRVGSGLSGNNLVYENNIFADNNYRIFDASGECGGIKLIDGYLHEDEEEGSSNITIKNNTFLRTKNCFAIWFDWMEDGIIVEGNKFYNNYVDISMEATDGTEENPALIKNNVFIRANPGNYNMVLPSISIQSSEYVYVYNNLFYDTLFGIVAKGHFAFDPAHPEAEHRAKIKYVKVYNNIFKDVTYPITLTKNGFTLVESRPSNVYGISSDYNLFFGVDKAFESVEPKFKFQNSPDRKTSFDEWQKYYGFDLHSKIVDPELSFSEDEFMIFHNSPVIDSGIELSDITEDIYGYKRPTGKAYDIGPFEICKNEDFSYFCEPNYLLKNGANCYSDFDCSSGICGIDFYGIKRCKENSKSCILDSSGKAIENGNTICADLNNKILCADGEWDNQNKRFCFNGCFSDSCIGEDKIFELPNKLNFPINENYYLTLPVNPSSSKTLDIFSNAPGGTKIYTFENNQFSLCTIMDRLPNGIPIKRRLIGNSNCQELEAGEGFIVVSSLGFSQTLLGDLINYPVNIKFSKSSLFGVPYCNGNYKASDLLNELRKIDSSCNLIIKGDGSSKWSEYWSNNLSYTRVGIRNDFQILNYEGYYAICSDETSFYWTPNCDYDSSREIISYSIDNYNLIAQETKAEISDENKIVLIDGKINPTDFRDISIFEDNNAGDKSYVILNNPNILMDYSLILWPLRSKSSNICIYESKDYLDNYNDLISKCRDLSCPGKTDKYTCIIDNEGSFVISGMKNNTIAATMTAVKRKSESPKISDIFR